MENTENLIDLKDSKLELKNIEYNDFYNIIQKLDDSDLGLINSK